MKHLVYTLVNLETSCIYSSQPYHNVHRHIRHSKSGEAIYRNIYCFVNYTCKKDVKNL